MLKIYTKKLLKWTRPLFKEDHFQVQLIPDLKELFTQKRKFCHLLLLFQNLYVFISSVEYTKIHFRNFLTVLPIQMKVNGVHNN